MKQFPYLCFGSVELSNVNRVSEYVTSRGIPGLNFAQNCGCPAIEPSYEPFISPASDPAPWYDATVPESLDFLGLVASDIRVASVASRDVNNRSGEGGVVSRLGLKHRLVQVKGQLIAATPLGMAYGEEWLREALAGGYQDGSCAGDVLQLLPACPEDLESTDADEYFRYLYKVGIIDGPDFTQITTLPECTLQNVSFQLAAGVPWLYQAPVVVIDDVVIDGVSGLDECAIASTNEWTGNATTVITLSAPDGPVEDITITATETYDNQCPEDDSMPSWKITIPRLEMEEVLTIDGVRRDLTVYNPASKRQEGGIPLIRTNAMFDWLDIPPCTHMCICVERITGTYDANDLVVRVEQVNRKL